MALAPPRITVVRPTWLLVAALVTAGCSHRPQRPPAETRASAQRTAAIRQGEPAPAPAPPKDERAAAKTEPPSGRDDGDKGAPSARGHRRKGLVTDKAAGPLRLGMSASEALELPGVSRGAGECACDYSLKIASLGLEAGVSGEQICEIFVQKRGLTTAEGLGVGSRYGEFEARYGEGIGEDATGMTGFERLPLYVGFEDAEPLPSTKITSLRIGGCGE